MPKQTLSSLSVFTSLSHRHNFSSSARGGSQQNEQELATKTLFIQHKRFYLDVKQNHRGRFIKVAEVGTAGRKSRLLLSMSAAREFRDHLTSFSELYASLGPPNLDNFPEDGKIKSEIIIKENRRYFLDLKENPRGRFLRVSQSISHGGPRTQIAIPAQGMIEFRDALTDLLDEFGGDDAGEDTGFRETLPDSTNFRVENKKFYFDVGQNKIGVFMRISEVKSNTRSSITIPERSWARFRDIFADYVDKINSPSAANSAVEGDKAGKSTSSNGNSK
ncbi:PREDICTED: transcriptional activator protein Pur-beta-like [Rhagoletis zephyria]|uniref:transcriptional activator protein Pur-beta-like n=1 Tax=Rhagoletis zephyria TaxID=28612 RepID=UPI00081169A6|nr:PREDICTED: transcriptional activator protein Pur-beta-like [Rhagoletis zephyria]